jgi:uncharacterized protein involved in exopolysaccharide biosynthesis
MDPTESLIDFREIIWKARQYRWLILLPIVVSLCGAFLYLKTASRLYESHVVLSVSDRPSVSGSLQSLVSPDRAAARPRERIVQINDRIHQTAFLATLANRLGMSASPELRAEAQSRIAGLEGVSADDLVRRMMTSRLGRKISVTPGTGDLVNLSVTDASPRQANQIVTELVSLLVEQTRQSTLERAQARGAFSSDQIAVYQERLRKSEDALRAFQESLIGRNIQASVINDGNLDLARTLIRTNTEEMRQIRDRIASERQAFATEAGAEARVPDLTSGTASSLESRLADLEINYALAQLGDEKSAAASAALQIRISQARQDLYNEYLSEARDATGPASEGAVLAAAGIALDRSILRTLSRKGDRLSSLIRAFGTSVQSSPRDQIELNRLRGAVDMNRQLLGTLEKEVTSSRISEALETSVLGMTIEVAEPAQVPLTPIYPDRKRTLGIALLLGPLVGIGLVFAIEQLGGVVRSVEQAEKEIGAPVIGTVPRVEEWARPGGFLKNYWAPISIVLVLLATGIFYTIHSASHARDQKSPASSVGER